MSLTRTRGVYKDKLKQHKYLKVNKTTLIIHVSVYKYKNK